MWHHTIMPRAMEDLVIIEEDLLIKEVVMVLEAVEVVAETLTNVYTVNCVARLVTLQIGATTDLIRIFKE